MENWHISITYGANAQIMIVIMAETYTDTSTYIMIDSYAHIVNMHTYHAIYHTHIHSLSGNGQLPMNSGYSTIVGDTCAPGKLNQGALSP